MDDADSEQLPANERMHMWRRDRKRKTKMVVDNAGIRAIQKALAARRARRHQRDEPGSPS